MALFAPLTHKERILQLLAEIDSLLLSRRAKTVENFSDVFHNSGHD